MNETINVLKDVIAIHLNFSTWTGRKILESTDLSLKGETPPKEIINLGSKHTTDPAALKVFSTLKRRAERACLRVGIPFMGGYAIPTKDANEVALELKKIVVQYNEVEKVKYLAKHESIQDEWMDKFPAYSNILIKALTPVNYVEQRIHASFSMFQLQSAASSVTAVDVGLSKQVDSMSESLDSEILKGSKALLDSLTKAIQPSQKNVNCLKQLRHKIEGLAFLNGKYSQLVRKIADIEEAMPITGKLSNDDVNKLSGLLYRMSDENKLTALMSNLQQEPLRPVSVSPIVEPTQVQTGQPAKGVTFDIGEDTEPTEPDDFDFGETPSKQDNSISWHF